MYTKEVIMLDIFYLVHSSPYFIKSISWIPFIGRLENSGDQDQLACEKKPADLDLHCFQTGSIWVQHSKGEHHFVCVDDL